MVKQNPMINIGLKTSRYLCYQPFYHSLSFVVTRCTTRCHSLSFVVTRCTTRCHSLPFAVTCCTTRCTTRCHSLSLVVPLVATRCHSLPLVVPLACFFINDLLKYVFMKLKKLKLVVVRIKKQVLHQ